MSTTGNRRVGRPSAKVARLSLRRSGTISEPAVDQAVEFFREISGPRFDEARFRALAQADLDRSFRVEGTMRQLAAIIASGDRTAELEQLDVPTLVIHGLADTLVRPSGGIATAAAIPRSRLLMFNDMGHDLPDTRHAEIADAIAHNAARAAVPAATGG
jgi:pimeloyl-ACP methyl ester carboxylesterase